MHYLLLLCLAVAAALPADPKLQMNVPASYPMPDMSKDKHSEIKLSKNEGDVEISLHPDVLTLNNVIEHSPKPEENGALEELLDSESKSKDPKKESSKESKEDAKEEIKKHKDSEESKEAEKEKPKDPKEEKKKDGIFEEVTEKKDDKERLPWQVPHIIQYDDERRPGFLSNLFEWMNSKLPFRLPFIGRQRSRFEEEPIYIVQVEPDYKY